MGVAPSRSDAAQPAVPPVPEKEKPKEKQSAQEEPPAQPDVQVTAPQTAPASPRKSGMSQKGGRGILILLVILYFLGKSNEKDAQPPTGTTEQQAPKQSEPTLSAEPAKRPLPRRRRSLNMTCCPIPTKAVKTSRRPSDAAAGYLLSSTIRMKQFRVKNSPRHAWLRQNTTRRSSTFRYWP